MSFSESIDDVVAENHNRLLTAHRTWERVRLSDVVSVLNGFAFPSAQFSPSEGTPLIRIRDVLRGETATFFAGDFDDAYLVKKGDLVVGMDGDFNSRRWGGRTALLNQRVCKLTPRVDYFVQQFLTYLLPGYLAAINAHTSAITVKHLSSRTVEKIPLPLPPLIEQRRIVAKLDELFSRLDAGVAALEAARAKLKRLRASVLKSAVEGRLTADWREAHPDAEPASELLTRILAERRTRQIEAKLAKWRARKEKADWPADKIAAAEPAERDKLASKYEEPKPPETDDLAELPPTWCWSMMEGLQVEGSTNGLSIKGSNEPPGIPALKLSAMGENGFDYNDRRYLPISEERANPIAIQEGDFFVSRGNGSLHLVGRATLAQEPPDLVVFPDTMIRLRLGDPSVVCQFVRMTWQSRVVRQQIEQAAKTTAGIYKISQRDVDSFVIPIPPEAEQAEIVRRVDEHLSRIDAAEKAIDAGLARSKRLRQAILKRAFEGKLVPQDPTDEPASILLERIRAEREATAADAKANGKPRRKKKAPKKAAAKATPKPASIDSAIRNPQSAIPAKQLSLIGDEPEATAPIDPAQVAEAFRQSHDGWSTDYVVVCPEANARFLDAASRLGIDVPAVAINKYLLNLRKTPAAGIDLPKATRRHRVEKGLAPFEFVSEWSIRIVQRQLKKELGREPSLDTIFCDPELAQRFDEAAARLKNKFSPLDYRWTALKLRKLKRGKASDLVEFGEPLGLEEAAASASERPAAYRVLAGEEPLFVGHTNNLRDQLLRYALTSNDAAIMVPSWAAGDLTGEQVVAFVEKPSSPASVASAVRDATRPSLNVSPISKA